MDVLKLNAVQLDRAAGVLVAAAAGDALGAGYEFRPTVPPESVQMVPGSLTGRPAGSWTDDTDMAVAVAQAAAQGLSLNTDEGLTAVAQGFLDWYASHPPDIGNQTRAVLSSTTDPKQLGDMAGKFQASHLEAAGNGSLMRTGPVALAHLGDDAGLVEAARAVSSLTHPHDLAGDACVLWCIAIDRAIREGRFTVTDGFDFLPKDRRGYWEGVIASAETAPLADLRHGNGFVVTALQAAWRAIVSTADAPSGPAHLGAALRAAVGIGGDTDTVAAIAGALLGARYGASAVPFAWRRNLAGWPPGVRHADLVAMGVLTARGGKPDNVGWPLVDDLSAYYEQRFRPRGLAVELLGHPGMIWGDVGALATVEADAVISLCRIGRHQRRGDQHYQVWLMDDDKNADLGFVLSDTADAVEALRRDHGKVLVHCVRAESRTPTVAVAWLVRHRGYSVGAATKLVLEALPGSSPNDCMRQGLAAVTAA